ncbi:hypothetical protein ACQKKX_01245 [Neorhizobium sp. NPDC001467]|uniref:hypothetical protein n=1 Tax=Neorhizobium sp. NPDC001467 TaxID=3390595 RepID=UPI003CFF2BBF
MYRLPRTPRGRPDSGSLCTEGQPAGAEAAAAFAPRVGMAGTEAAATLEPPARPIVIVAAVAFASQIGAAGTVAATTLEPQARPILIGPTAVAAKAGRMTEATATFAPQAGTA